MRSKTSDPKEGAELVPPYDAKIAEFRAELHRLREHLQAVEAARVSEATRADRAEARLGAKDVEIRKLEAMAEAATKKLRGLRSSIAQFVELMEDDG